MTDPMFTTFDIRGEIDNESSREIAWNVGKALAEWLPTDGTVIVLRGEAADERTTEAVIEGLRLQGRSVLDSGHGDKLQLVDELHASSFGGGVLVSFDSLTNQSSLELYQAGGKLVDSETGLKEIQELVEAGNFVPAASKGPLEVAHVEG